MKIAMECRGGVRRWLQILLVLMLGFYSLSAQTLLLRAFLAIYDGSEIGIGVFFGSWLIWIVIGAFLSQSAMRLRWRPDEHFDLLILLYLPAFLLQLYLIDHSRAIAGVAAFEAFPLLKMVPISILVNAPTSIITGLLFPLACRWTSSEHSSSGSLPVATTYILEALGAFGGGVAITFLLWLKTPDTTVFCYNALALTIACAAYRLFCRRRPLLLGLPIAVAAVLAAGLDHNWTEVRNRESWSRLMAEEDYGGSFTTAQTPYIYGTTDGQFNLLAWGTVAESVPQAEHAAEVAALTMAQHPGAEQILVLGRGSYSICSTFARLPTVKGITWLASDPQYAARLLKVLPTELKSSSNKISIPEREIKAYLRSHAELFDLIVINLPDPDTLLRNRYFTSEFYRLLKTRLEPDGVVAARVSANENFMSGELARIGASIHATLRKSFADIAIKPGDQSWLLASDGGGLIQAPGRLRNRFRGIPGSAQIYPPEAVKSLYRRNRVRYQLDRYREVAALSRPGELINSDRHPKALLNTLMVAARRQGADSETLSGILIFTRYGFLWLLALMAIYAAIRYGSRTSSGPGIWDSAFLVWSSGLVGLNLSIVLMFTFQSRFGSVYLYAGLLSSLFMLGLFMGGTICRSLSARRVSTTPLLVGGIGLHSAVCVGLYWLINSIGQRQYIWLFPLGGILSGIYVPIAARRLRQAQVETGRAGSIIDACDHLGGAFGALLTGLVLLPLFGSLRSLILMAVLLSINIPAALSSEAVIGKPDTDRTGRIAHRLGILLLLIAAMALIVSNTVQRVRREKGSIDLAAIAERLAPNTVRESMTIDGRSQVEYFRDPDGGRIIFETGSLAADIHGYNGPIAMAVMIATNGVIDKIEIVRHRETPYYMRMLSDWIGNLRGCDIFEEGLSRRVDAVSGATATSAAILRSLDRAGGIIRSATTGTEPEYGGGGRRPIDPGAIMLLAVVPLALWIRKKPRRRLRQIFLLGIVVVFGAHLNVQYSLQNVLGAIGFQPPSTGLSSGFLLTMGIPVLVLVFGNIYCGYLCPFGALQELVGDLLPNRWRVAPDKNIWRYARWLKYAILFGLAMLFAFERNPMLGSVDPLVGVFGSGWALPGMGVLALLLLSLFFKRFWCRNLCPAGAMLALLNRARLWRAMIHSVRPGHCDLGVCSRNELDCINCDRCRFIDSTRLRATRTIGRALLVVTAIYALLWLGDVFGRKPAPTGGRIADSEAVATKQSGKAVGKARDVDMKLLETMIENSELSDREAMYYEKIEQ